MLPTAHLYSVFPHVDSTSSLSGQSTYISSAAAMCTLPKKKAPAPPPPTTHGHTRNPSDPCLTLPRVSHVRTPSDPPPLPAKVAGKWLVKGTKSLKQVYFQYKENV